MLENWKQGKRQGKMPLQATENAYAVLKGKHENHSKWL